VWQPEEKIKPVSDHKWASLAPKSESLFGQTNSNQFLSEKKPGAEPLEVQRPEGMPEWC
tara:strand:+ start:76 stop:252 length:177 start_codon:yes stop_codon:yes gene_type:complete